MPTSAHQEIPVVPLKRFNSHLASIPSAKSKHGSLQASLDELKEDDAVQHTHRQHASTATSQHAKSGKHKKSAWSTVIYIIVAIVGLSAIIIGVWWFLKQKKKKDKKNRAKNGEIGADGWTWFLQWNDEKSHELIEKFVL